MLTTAIRDNGLQLCRTPCTVRRAIIAIADLVL